MIASPSELRKSIRRKREDLGHYAATCHPEESPEPSRLVFLQEILDHPQVFGVTREQRRMARVVEGVGLSLWISTKKRLAPPWSDHIRVGFSDSAER